MGLNWVNPVFKCRSAYYCTASFTRSQFQFKFHSCCSSSLSSSPLSWFSIEKSNLTVYLWKSKSSVLKWTREPLFEWFCWHYFTIQNIIKLWLTLKWRKKYVLYIGQLLWAYFKLKSYRSWLHRARGIIQSVT